MKTLSQAAKAAALPIVVSTTMFLWGVVVGHATHECPPKAQALLEEMK
jgi:hypothetical protein